MNKRDEDVVGSVRHALALEPGLDAPRITITMLGPELALTGILDTPEQVRLAEEVARRAAPSVPIENDLTVGESPHALHNKALAARAMEAYERVRDTIRTRPVNGGVEVLNGIARLHGTCSTAADRQLLIDAVAAVPGIGRVIADDFQVNWFGSADDIRLGNLASEALKREDLGLADDVAVDVRDRSAHLTGRVRDDRARQRAVQIVSQVAGIKHVHDELTLYRAGTESTGELKLQYEVKRALSEAGLPAPNINVFVNDGIAHIDGEVENVEQVRRAFDVARGVKGIQQVDNLLKVVDRRGEQPPHRA